MKRFVPIVLALLMCTVLYAKTQPGKSCLSARVTNFGHEFGYGKMISETAMFLIDGELVYTSGSSEAETSAGTFDGPKTSDFGLQLYPEYRVYTLPSNRVNPYFGVYGLIGFGSESTETTTGTTTATVTGSATTFGVGMSFGAELMLNNFLSIAAHSRVVQFSYASTKEEPGGNVTNKTSAITFAAMLEPALYIRIYF